MCVLASPHGKRQHLAVSHEKGKITILQLSALLKQADSSKKKLTLTVSVSLRIESMVKFFMKIIREKQWSIDDLNSKYKHVLI